MSNSSEEESFTEAAPEESARGRPAGKADSTKRFRRTAQEISDDKVRIAQMRLDALRESEERKLANKKTRKPRAKAAVEEAAIPPKELRSSPKKEVPRDDSPSPERLPIGSRREQLYDSWFPSSPRTRRY